MVNVGTLEAAQALLATARAALKRKERETASMLMDEADRLLGLAWDVPVHWAQHRPW